MQASSHQRLAVATLVALFFMWGLITVLNDILIPHLKELFTLDYVAAMLIQFCFFMAYGIMSIPCGKMLQRIGYKRSLMWALVIAALGCLLFLPAAWLHFYPLFLFGLFVLASGIVLLQVSANPYVALLGSPSSASSRLNLAQAFNSLGTTIGPLLGSSLILSAAQSGASGIEGLYASLALLLLLVLGGIWSVKLPEIQPSQYQHLRQELIRHADEAEFVRFIKTQLNKVWRFPHLFYGVGAIFFYVGGEVSIGSMLVSYLSNPEIGHMSQAEAGAHVAYYWGGAMIGRFVGYLLLKRFGSCRLLAIHSLAVLALLATTLLTSGHIAVWSVLAIGLFNSIMFPTIFSLAIRGLDQFTPQGSGLLCTAIVGGAFIPLLQGFAADHLGVQTSFIVPIICYLYILFYAAKGALAYCRIKGK